MQRKETRREFPRIAASFDVFCLQDNLHERSARAYNLSAGGVALEINQPISHSERLAMVFQLPNTSDVVHVTGKVAWHQSRGDAFQHASHLYTAGVAFLNLEEPFKTHISNYTEGGGEITNHDDEIETIEADFEVDFSGEEGYSARRKNMENRLAGKLPGKLGFSLLIGAIILGLFVLVAILFPRSSNIDSGNRMRSLERRIKQLEERLYRLDRIEATLEQIEEKNKQSTTSIDTFRTPETPSKRSTAQTSEKQTKAIYHEVLAGETLYGIGLRYGITVDELRRLNKLEPEATIYPEQRLLIRPAGNQ